MKKSGIFLFFCCCIAGSYAYTDKPVLVHLSQQRQSDTLGFNIVYELEKYIYELVQTGKVTLWHSAKKELKISPKSLEGIENSSGIKFDKSENIFFHEFWTQSRRRTSFTIVGISFINELKDKSRISYGYVDLAEAWPFLAARKIDCNVNGPASLSLTEALYSRNYNFNVVQFGRKDFNKKPEKSLEIRDKAFYSKRKVEGLFSIPATKNIIYNIEQDYNDSLEIGNILFTNLQNYLNANREVLFNLGAGKYFDYLTFHSEVAVTRIEVNEIWERNSSYIDYKIQSLSIYVNNKKLDPVSIGAVMSWDILFNFKTVSDVLKEKKFNYFLLKMNNTYIAEHDSPKFIKALEKYSWTQVSRYVIFY